MLKCYIVKIKSTNDNEYNTKYQDRVSNNKMKKPQCKLVLYVLDKATGIAKEHSINKISVVMIAGKFKIWDLGLQL